jgi:hypothetical protein
MKDVDIKPFIDILGINRTDSSLKILLRMPSGSSVNYNPSLLLDAFNRFSESEPDITKINRVRILTANGEDFR